MDYIERARKRIAEIDAGMDQLNYQEIIDYARDMERHERELLEWAVGQIEVIEQDAGATTGAMLEALKHPYRHIIDTLAPEVEL